MYKNNVIDVNSFVHNGSQLFLSGWFEATFERWRVHLSIQMISVNTASCVVSIMIDVLCLSSGWISIWWNSFARSVVEENLDLKWPTF